METQNKQKALSLPWVQSVLGIGIIAFIFAGLLIYKLISSRVSIDLGRISAPEIVISPQQQGILDGVFVKAGDHVEPGQALAHVGGETLYAKVSGIVISVEDVPGQVFSPNQAVVTMIDPNELRVVGTIDENKGLSDIKVGDVASFTVDAFGGKKFTGVVDEISPTSDDSGIAFAISDKREIKKFTIKIKYNIDAHPEFKNGMSAKIKVYIR